MILFRTCFPLGSVSEMNAFLFLSAQSCGKKSLWRDAQNNKTNSQRWDSCALPKAAKKPCYSHWIRHWHCKFQPGWWQNRVPNLPMPWCHIYVYWGMLQSDVYGLTVETDPMGHHKQELYSCSSCTHSSMVWLRYSQLPTKQLVMILPWCTVQASARCNSGISWASGGCLSIWQLMKDFSSMNWSNYVF